MATYDWASPTVTTNYLTFVNELHARLDQLAVGFSSADTHNNIPTDTISFRSNKWQKWSGSAWADLSSSYAINISGTSSNITGVLAVGKGGTNLTSYTVGDLIYSSGPTSLAKLTAVASGNVLISNGAVTAPSWGKVGLTTHITGTLSVSNGGTGATTLSGILKGNGAGAITAAVAGTDYFPVSGGSLSGSLSVTGDIYAASSLSVTGDIYAAGSLSVTGDIYAAGNVTAYSDIRLKSNINTLEKALDKVLQLRGVSYTKAGKPEIGVIAQEVEKIIPEVVCNTGEYKAVAYGNLVALLIEAIKELDRKVDARTCN